MAGEEGERHGRLSSRLAQEASVTGERPITAHYLLRLLAQVWVCLAPEPQCLLAAVGICFPACDSGESQGCRIQPGPSLFQFTLHSPFLPPLWSLFPKSSGGPINVPLGFLKKAPFFSFIIKLPRNNGCHLKTSAAERLPHHSVTLSSALHIKTARGS